MVQASVVGLPSQKYGEEVVAFLQHRCEHEKPSLQTLRSFVHESLGWHKAPVRIFWLGEDEDFPKTGSGKIMKHVLRDDAVRLLESAPLMAKL